jgi:signal peptidase I
MFLLGDNRDLSADSRFPAARGAAIGIVPQENLIGRAGFIFFSTDGSAHWLNPLSWVTAARWERIGAPLL